MRALHAPVALACVCLSGLLGASAAQAAAPVPAAPPAGAAPAAGSMQLAVLHPHGNPAFMIAGQKMIVRGVVTPYVPGQTVKLSVYRDGRKVAVKVMPVLPLGAGTGQVHIVYGSSSPGLVQVRGAHYADAAQVQFTALTHSIRFTSTNLSPGAQGTAVWLLQAEL
ncbi:MAG TPA: hypothetical protein VNZ05_02380, partial [Solirubrobacteraceae bacterium]|nr:hypothetical protein [Solirubrobacteraceae bacterium]